MIAFRDLFTDMWLAEDQEEEPVLRSDRVPAMPNPELPGSRSAALKKMLEGE